MTARPCIFGEVLFDHFPDGRRVLGGAPFNVAWHLQALGAAPYLISRVGADDDGTAVQSAMSGWGMDQNGLTVDNALPTGQVRVSIEHNEPAYDIVRPVAWDQIRVPGDLPEFGLLYHGSLALRSEVSRTSCEELRARKDSDKKIVFVDVNLRSPWWSRAEVLHAISGAQWVKLNDDELDLLIPGRGDYEQRARSLLQDFALDGLLLTRGSRGAVLIRANGERCVTRPEEGIEIMDTVGAGDAMAAVMILGILEGWNPQLSLERAQTLASAIVTRRGATVPDPDFYRQFISAWSLGDGMNEPERTP